VLKKCDQIGLPNFFADPDRKERFLQWLEQRCLGLNVEQLPFDVVRDSCMAGGIEKCIE